MRLEQLLNDESLDFARRHLTAYYDSDFFPKPFEFECIWFYWDELKQTPRDSVAPRVPPFSIPWKKARGGYRVVHQMDPLDAICYTATVHSLAQSIERARVPSGENIACSYRIRPNRESFFDSGSGFSDYREHCEQLTKTHKYVLTTDISDFYNRIYVHRLENAVSQATGDDSGKAIENYLLAINNKASQGIPVGPSASVVLSEAALIDVDQFISNRGFQHVRYVDDIRIFSQTEHSLDIVLQDLTVYLHRIHRLGLVGEKTAILESEKFVQQELNNRYQLEKLEILEEIEVINPYTHEVQQVHAEIISDAGPRLEEALGRILKFEHLDLGVARAIIRRARAHRLRDIAPLLIKNCVFFRPVINDVVLYLDAISDESSIGTLIPLLLEAAEARLLDSPSVAEWFAWYVSRHRALIGHHSLRLLLQTPERMSYLARAAVLCKNVAWVRDHKDRYWNLGAWDRRAVIYASQIMAPEERRTWLNAIKKNHAITLLEKWMIDWVLVDAPAAKPLSSEWDGMEDMEDSIPF